MLRVLTATMVASNTSNPKSSTTQWKICNMSLYVGTLCVLYTSLPTHLGGIARHTLGMLKLCNTHTTYCTHQSLSTMLCTLRHQLHLHHAVWQQFKCNYIQHHIRTYVHTYATSEQAYISGGHHCSENNLQATKEVLPDYANEATSCGPSLVRTDSQYDGHHLGSRLSHCGRH